MADRSWDARGSALPVLGPRVAMFLLVAGLGLVAVGVVDTLLWCGLLACASLPGVLVPDHPLMGRAGRATEAIVVVLGTASTIDDFPWLLPYLPITLAAATLFGGHPPAARMHTSWWRSPLVNQPGITEATVLGVLAAAGLFGAAYVSDDVGSRFVESVAQMIAISALAAIGGHWLRRKLIPDMPSRSSSVAEATALLTQLRAVARQLPGGTLDPGGICDDLLDKLGTVADFDRAAVLAAGGSRLVVLAQVASERVDWETSLHANTLLSDVWASQQPHSGLESLSRSAAQHAATLVVPLVADRRTVGLIALESDELHPFSDAVVDAVSLHASSAALRLETALLFDEVRSLATTEERQRLAREIHDGIAQELAMLGYGIDNALAQLPTNAAESDVQLRELRSEVTRLVTELRLSLFELRSDVDPHGGLTTAIADYARTVGASAGLRVHLSLDEGGARLPAATEAELLRIAQEAITNARKHARADNLWVTCEVDPPYVRIEVTDDGKGLPGDTGDGRYGLAIMSERAERIRGSLEIRPRDPHGTTVAVLLGTSARRGTVSTVTAEEN